MGGGLNQNFSCDGNDYQPTWEDILKASIIGSISIVIVVGNLFSIVVFNKKSSKKIFLKKVRLTMNSLICTDLGMGLLTCPFFIYPALYKCWPYSEMVCKVEALFFSALFHESTLSLVLIALDRYFSVHHYLRYNSIMTSRKYVMVILFTWFSTFAVYSNIIFVGDQFYYDIIGINCEPYYANKNVGLTVICIFYFMPMILFLYSYGSIFAKANKKRRIRSFTAGKDNNDKRNKAVGQILKTSKFLAAITAGFVISVTPWTLSTVIVAVTNIELNHEVDFAVTWLAVSNSFWNVMIYSVLNRKFRLAVSTLVKGRNLPSCLAVCCGTSLSKDRNSEIPTENGHAHSANGDVQHDDVWAPKPDDKSPSRISTCAVTLQLRHLEMIPGTSGVFEEVHINEIIPFTDESGKAAPDIPKTLALHVPRRGCLDMTESRSAEIRRQRVNNGMYGSAFPE